MPRNDRNGPMGAGPRSGKGLGMCRGNQGAGRSNMQGRGFGRGNGYCRGMGYGMGPGRNADFSFDGPDAPQDERSFLKTRADWLQQELEAVKKQLDSNAPDKSKA